MDNHEYAMFMGIVYAFRVVKRKLKYIKNFIHLNTTSFCKLKGFPNSPYNK